MEQKDRMQQSELLLDVIGETDAELIPALPRRKHRGLRYIAAGGALCAAVLLGVLVWPRGETKPTVHAVELSADVTAGDVESVYPDRALLLGQTEFALQLLRETANEGENTLISPYSVMQALAVTAGGARGRTRTEMESVLGGSMETLDPALYRIRTGQPSDDGCRLVTANSIWCKGEEDLQVRQVFLQTNADYYDAGIFRAPMDAQTVDDMNGWFDEKTEHMIPQVIDELSDDCVMCLLNAVTFDAQWNAPYPDEAVGDWHFTAYDGSEQPAEMMHSTEYTYLSGSHAEGFMKYYAGNRYAFAALLPEEGMTVTAYLNTLTAQELRDMLTKPTITTVHAQLPRFDTTYQAELSGALGDMGMPSAFSADTADFSGIADRELYLSRVQHKTCISVTQQGTRAAAATVVEMVDGGGLELEEPKEIRLDRPFVYCIVDTQYDLPVFIGTLETLG